MIVVKLVCKYQSVAVIHGLMKGLYGGGLTGGGGHKCHYILGYKCSQMLE